MTLSRFFVPLAAGIAAFPAIAAVTTVGNSAARSCYEAADSKTGAAATALSDCDRALAAEALSRDEMVATYVNRGILRMRKGDIDAAIEDFDTALARDASQPEAYLNKAVALMQRPGEADAALSLFTVAIQKRTRRPALAYLGRAMAYEELGNLRSAYSDYRSASLADPEWKQPRMELARFKVKSE